MEFGVYLDNVLQTVISATDEKDVWQKLKKAGIQNRTNILSLRIV